MTPTIIIANPQNRVKDSYASSPSVGLTIRANGEENVKIIDKLGNIQLAGIEAPTVAPVLTDGGSGSMTVGSYVGYIYVYAATTNYPFVNSTLAINGSLAPRSNQSPDAEIQVPTDGAIAIEVTYTTRSDIDAIWIFRTNYFETEIEAQTAAQAGEAFYVGTIANDTGEGSGTFTDTEEFTGTDQVELDNFVASQFQLVTFFDPYWWGFSNFPFIANATWDDTGLVTINGTDQWFTGRNGQNVTLTNVTTGGFDGQGTFQFLQVTNTTGQLTLDGTSGTAQTVAAGSGQVLIQGPASTLYRSKPRNPFAWGYTQQVGTSLVPIEYAFQVGGGIGTAIAVVPNVSLLKLDLEQPTKCFTLNLRLAGTTGFEPTLRCISEIYSVSSHWSQFQASTQEGYGTLWGIDYKNFAILQSNGLTQLPISGAIPRILRRLTSVKSQQLLAHGIYDPFTELNCLWVTTTTSATLVNYLIYQHAPTGFWGFVDDKDILCSASIYDSVSNSTKTLVGTQTGILGQAFVDGLFANWNPPSGTFSGSIISATANSIAISTGAFNTTNDGVIGNWCLITDVNDESEQWARISGVTSNILTFDLIYPYIGGFTANFNPLPLAGYKFYIGLIQCNLRKDFDLDSPSMDKKLSDVGITQLNAVQGDTNLRFYREWQSAYIDQFATLQTQYANGDLSNFWSSLTQAPQLRSKTFGLEVVNRSYSDWCFVNFLFNTNVTN